MKLCDTFLKNKYQELLNNILPAFIEQLPDTHSGDYILIDSVNHSDENTFQSFDTNTSIRVVIHTRSLKYNNGLTLESKANDVMQAIMPTPRGLIASDTYFIINSTRLASTSSDTYNLQGYTVKERILVFEHLVMQKGLFV